MVTLSVLLRNPVAWGFCHAGKRFNCMVRRLGAGDERDFWMFVVQWRESSGVVVLLLLLVCVWSEQIKSKAGGEVDRR